MAKVEFIYESAKTIIQCNPEDRLEDIVQKFTVKLEKNTKDLFFIYDGQLLDIKKTFKESVNDVDKSRNQMNVIVNNKSEEEKNISFLQKSKYVICPECKRIFFLQLMILRFHSMIVKMDTK